MSSETGSSTSSEHPRGLLDGKVAVVTGSSRGIGRAVAQRLAMNGALVAIHYGSNAEAAALTVSEIEANGGNAFAVQADLSSIAQIQRFYQALDAESTKRTGNIRHYRE